MARDTKEHVDNLTDEEISTKKEEAVTEPTKVKKSTPCVALSVEHC